MSLSRGQNITSWILQLVTAVVLFQTLFFKFTGAKESVYKTWYPITGRWLDFSEATVTVRVDGTFHADVLVPGPVTGFDGRWLNVPSGSIPRPTISSDGQCCIRSAISRATGPPPASTATLIGREIEA